MSVTVSSGQNYVVSSGTTDSGDIIQSGGTETVLSGGVSDAATVQAGGGLSVSGTTSGATISGPGAGENVGAGGVVDATTLVGGGGLFIGSGGTASGTIISSGTNAGANVSAGGAEYATTILSGGYQTVFSGGTTSGVTISAGGYMNVLPGANVSAVTIMSGGNEEFHFQSSVSGFTISSGVIVSVDSGGSASGAIVESGGAIVFSSGTVGVATTLENGAQLITSNGGMDSGTVISSGGYADISAGGVETGGAVLSAGFVTVFSGGAAAVTVDSGGDILVSSGGSVAGTTVLSSGGITVSSGGIVTGLTISSGGGLTDGVSFGGEVTTVIGSGTYQGRQLFVDVPTSAGLEVGYWLEKGDGTLSSGGTVTVSGAPLIVDGATSIAGTGVGLLGSGGVDLFIRNSAGQIGVGEFTNGAVLVTSAALTYDGDQQTIDPSVEFIGTGSDLMGAGGRDAFFRTSTGGLAVWEVNTSGQILTGAYLSSGGEPVTVDPSATVVGGGENLLGDGGTDVFMRAGSVLISVEEFNTSGIAVGSAGLSYNGDPLSIDTATEFLGTGSNLMGAEGRDAFFLTSAGGLAVWEINGSGGVITGAYLMSGGDPVTVDPGATVVGMGTNLLGDGGADVFIRAGTGQISVAEFNVSGVAVGSAALTYDGDPLSIDGATEFVGTGANFMGAGGQDAFFRNSAGGLEVWEINSSGGVVTGAYLTPVTVDQAATVVGTGVDVLGDGGTDAFIRAGNGQISVAEFTFTSGVTEVGSAVLTYNGNPQTIGGATEFIGTGSDLLGDGGQDAFFRTSTGGLAVWEINGSGQIITGAYLMSGGAPVEKGPDATVVGMGTDLLGDNGKDIFLRSALGFISVAEFNTSGVELGSAALTYNGTPQTLNGASEFIGTGANVMGTGGQDAFFRTSTGGLAVWEMSTASGQGGQIVTGEYLQNTTSGAFQVAQGTTVVGTGIDATDNTAAIELRYANGTTAVYDVHGTTLSAGPTGAHINSPQSDGMSQLTQAMASLSSGGAVTTTGGASSDTSQQTTLASPH